MNGRRTVASVHNDWLSLVEPVGAFLTIPVLKRVLPNGIPPVERDARADVRQRLQELGPDVASRTNWLQWMLCELLSLGPRLREASAIPAGLAHTVAERHTTLRPDFVIVEPQNDGTDRARVLGIRWPLRTALDRRPTIDERGQPTDWAATPVERAALLCRAVNVPLAIVTDTDRVALVWAPVSGPSGHAVWTSSLFAEERLLLDSFVSLLGAQRLFGVAQKETLEALLTESGSAQAEVTGKLGEQVRRAVELLVDAFSRADRAASGRILAGVQPPHVYNAAVTVMMRLVVLLAAEERRLLPADDPIYCASYSILTTREQLERDSMRDGIETLEKRHTAWHRLLATFRAVHGGIEHDRLRLPAYGGSLFDPSRYPFLDSPPISVDDRAMLAVLNALQVLTFRQGAVTEARRISYLNLDVEQIGHVYEGLLDHGCARVEEVVLGLLGSKGEEPEIPLGELERELRKGEDSFAGWLAEKGGPTVSTIKKRLYEDLDSDQDHRLRAACDNDKATYERVRPFGGLVRKDLRDLPAVFMPGSLYVTQVSLRRDSGTAYTTKELADEIVHYALEPLVYSPGPAEGAEPANWKLKSSAELRHLRICDLAVGSGAILVAACRYLADRLVEAWKAEAGGMEVPAILDGIDETEWTLVARRTVTDHCLYGVDRNPMAIEMAKLSLWLTTMAKERPFTFLDHQVRSGDSLLGITSLDQVRWVHIDPVRGREMWARRPLFTDPRKSVDARVTEALDRARALAAIDVISLGDVERKGRLHAEMVNTLAPLGVLADAVVGAALADAGGAGNTDALLESVADLVEIAFKEGESPDACRHALAELRDQAQFWLDTERPDLALDRNCLHWPLTFPEVFLAPGRSGFDAVIGNPPFLGGKRISGAMGSPYREFLVERIGAGVKGNSDLVAYFFLRAFSLLTEPGSLGLLATDKIAQGDTRDVGLDQLALRMATITRAVPRESWPGTTAVEVAKVWIWKGDWRGPHILSGTPVRSISPLLVVTGDLVGNPHRLKANEGKSFQGSIVLGMGFVLTPAEAHALIDKDPRNRDVLFPYLDGDDLNSYSDQSASRWVINFGNLPLERAATGSWLDCSPSQRVAWLRTGVVPSDYPHQVASDYPDCLDIVTKRVRPERATKADDVRKAPWWRFWRIRQELYSAIAGLERVLVTARVSPTCAMAWVDPHIVLHEKIVVFPTSADEDFAVLQSSLHWEWAREYTSTRGTVTLNYSPSDCFETFAYPESLTNLGPVGKEYATARASLMSERSIGLTSLYNCVHDSTNMDGGIERLRQVQCEMDCAVARAFGWGDLGLDHGFHTTKQGIRYTIGVKARAMVLNRLLELNHHRYREEVAQGLHQESVSRKSRANRDGGKESERAPLLESL